MNLSSYDFIGDGIEEDMVVLPICYGCDTPKVAEGYIRISKKKTLFLCRTCASAQYAEKVFHPL
jgi:hypothetical protein